MNYVWIINIIIVVTIIIYIIFIIIRKLQFRPYESARSPLSKFDSLPNVTFHSNFKFDMAKV